jgi:hypothetical protein
MWGTPVIVKTTSTGVILTTASFLLCGCQIIGPASLQAGRRPYNEAIASTSQQETLMNIVRASKQQPPLFLSITEVDAAVQLQASATAGETNIGAHAGTSGGTLAGRVGAAGAGLQYQESDTARLLPVQGAALNAQVASPVTVDTLSALYNSDWPIGSILAFAVDRLTPTPNDTNAGLNIIMQLDNCSALVFAPTKSELLEKHDASPPNVKLPGNSITIQTQPQQTQGNNTLGVYYMPKHSDCNIPSRGNHVITSMGKLWMRLGDFYSGTQPDTTDSNILELRASPLTYTEAQRNGGNDDHSKSERNNKRNLAPIISTRTAIGILNRSTAEFGSSRIQFVSEDQYDRIRGLQYNNSFYFHACSDEKFYYLSSELVQELSLVPLSSSSKERYRRIDNLIMENTSPDSGSFGCLYTLGGFNIEDEYALDQMRRFILIVRTQGIPKGTPFVSWQDQDGMLYYIRADDTISQANFALIGELMTIQSNVTPAPSLTSVSIGPH